SKTRKERKFAIVQRNPDSANPEANGWRGNRCCDRQRSRPDWGCRGRGRRRCCGKCGRQTPNTKSRSTRYNSFERRTEATYAEKVPPSGAKSGYTLTRQNCEDKI